MDFNGDLQGISKILVFAQVHLRSDSIPLAFFEPEIAFCFCQGKTSKHTVRGKGETQAYRAKGREIKNEDQERREREEEN